MNGARFPDGLVVQAPAKVNLFLEVLGKRSDGYHEIATLMVAVDLYDTLTFKEEPADTIALHCDHATLSTGPDNLVLRAANLLCQRAPAARGATIHLAKRIPMSAGLAGGSSDAAATLVGLNRMWQLNLPQTELAEVAAQLGSDVAFFLNGPAAWCTGRGELVEPIQLGKQLDFVVAYPEVGLATRDVYQKAQVPRQPQTGAEIRAAVERGDVEEIGRRLHNRLELAAQQLCPELADVRRGLEEAKPAGQLMSGSGSSHFALCRNEAEAPRIAHELRHGMGKRMFPHVYLVRSCMGIATG